MFAVSITSSASAVNVAPSHGGIYLSTWFEEIVCVTSYLDRMRVGLYARANTMKQRVSGKMMSGAYETQTAPTPISERLER